MREATIEYLWENQDFHAELTLWSSDPAEHHIGVRCRRCQVFHDETGDVVRDCGPDDYLCRIVVPEKFRERMNADSFLSSVIRDKLWEAMPAAGDRPWL